MQFHSFFFAIFSVLKSRLCRGKNLHNMNACFYSIVAILSEMSKIPLNSQGKKVKILHENPCKKSFSGAIYVDRAGEWALDVYNLVARTGKTGL